MMSEYLSCLLCHLIGFLAIGCMAMALTNLKLPAVLLAPYFLHRSEMMHSSLMPHYTYVLFLCLNSPLFLEPCFAGRLSAGVGYYVVFSF
jgi:hypothetical protein